MNVYGHDSEQDSQPDIVFISHCAPKGLHPAISTKWNSVLVSN